MGTLAEAIQMRTHNICFSVAILISTHNICFYGELWKIIKSTVKAVLVATSIKQAICLKRPVVWFPIVTNKNKFFLHTRQGFPRFTPILDISVLYQGV